MAREPIFIVGVQRSGTTLLSAQLAAHSQLTCGPETHFFRRLARAGQAELLSADNWPTKALEFILSITHSNYSGDHQTTRLIEKYQLSETDVATYLQRSAPTAANLLRSVTEQYAQRQGAARWVEKTPDHMEYLPLLRQTFPNAPVIRIVRDPRDVALSLTKVPWGAKSFVEGLLFWKRLDDASQEFFRTDPLAYTLRFEDLVADPRQELEKLCAFIGEPFEASMLDTSATGRQVNSRGVAWKDKASKPVDSGRSNVWRTEISTGQNALAEALVGQRLDEFGYLRLVSFDRLGQILPRLDLISKYASGLEQVVGQGIRFWVDRPGEAPQAQVYLGDPAGDGWFQESSATRLADTLKLASEIRRAKSRNEQIFWITMGSAGGWSGVSAAVLTNLLQPYRLTWQPANV